MTRPSPSTNPSFYEILNLPFPSTGLTKQQLKLAYHKALLKHHPDKAPAVAKENIPAYDANPAQKPTGQKITIDAITTAYKTLSDPVQRAEYDRVLRLDRSRLSAGDKSGNGTVFHTGLEVVDLEDLDCDENDEEAVWHRGCRCGDERGFLVSEGDLEREVESGEIVVGCRGCSLYMKILFAVQD
ncbi:Diphthamide biosynthesis protein 4 [Aspergillus multicolor]|uniref:diphthamide biosynthesis protein 4 n=1 Tax=Aspergillus multicolor TaxID=41759 RepID=UPI003CCDB109